MNDSVNLKPFIKYNLKILFIALNPPQKSNEIGHYFSRVPNFWNQLFLSGLITRKVNKETADEIIFGSNNYNYKNWNYGITDLVPNIIETSSSKVNPTKIHVNDLKNKIIEYKPKNAIILHSKVRNKLYNKDTSMKKGNIGKILIDEGCHTNFFLVPFPHGDSTPQEVKINLYKEIKSSIDN